MLKTAPPIHHPLLKKGEKKIKPSLLRTALMGGKEKLLTINNNWFLFLYFSFLHSLHQQPLSGHALQGADSQDVGAAGEGGDVHCGGHAVGGLHQQLAAR